MSFINVVDYVSAVVIKYSSEFTICEDIHWFPFLFHSLLFYISDCLFLSTMFISPSSLVISYLSSAFTQFLSYLSLNDCSFLSNLLFSIFLKKLCFCFFTLTQICTLSFILKISTTLSLSFLLFSFIVNFMLAFFLLSVCSFLYIQY